MGSQICCDTRITTSLPDPAQKPEQKLQSFLELFPYINEVIPTKDDSNFIKNWGLHEYEYGKGTFLGKLTDEKRNGFGIMMFTDGMYYEGQWENDMFAGDGKFVYLNGDFYDGTWKKGIPHGTGLYVSREPIWRYDGEWLNGEQSGKGKETFDDGSFYEGQFLNGLRHGKGKFRNHDGRFYEGSFINGEVEGVAKACDQFFLYEGEWKKGKMHGAGKSLWQNQSSRKLEAEYIGEYKDGQKHGFGEYRQKQVTFKGNWQQGYITNTGIVIQTPNKPNSRPSL